MSGQERGGGRNIQRGTPYRGRGSAGPSRYHHRISGGPQQYLRRNNNDGGRGGINPYAQRTYSAAASDIDQQSVERADPRSSSCSFPPQEQSIERTQSFSSSAASSLVSNFGPRVKLEEEQQQHQQQQQKPSELAVVPSSSSSKALLFPCRPGFGTKGRKCLVKANYFLVQLSPDKSPHHYDVSITPEVMSKGTSRAVIKQLVNLNKESYLGENELVYDGGKSIYTAGPLPFTSKNFTIKLLNQANGDKSTPRREKQFTVSIRLVGRPDLHHLQQFFMAKQRDAPQEIFQLLDLVLRESPSLNYITVGRSFFSPLLGEPSPIGEGFMCWNGFHQSLRPTQMGLSLNIDLSARSFFKPILVIDFVSEFLNTDTSEPLSDKDRAKVKKVLKGVKVEVTYRSNNSRPFRRYRISGITEQQTNQLMFPIDEEGTQMTVVQYFKDTYKKTLEHATWPSLQVGNDGRTVYIPMEVCKIVDGQRYSKKLNKKQVAGMLRATCQCPYKRENSILKMVRANNYNGDKFVNEFGLLVSEELTSVEARVLFPPQLKYHDTGIDIDCVPRGGQWNMMNKKMANGATINYWTCLNFSRLNQDVVVRFCRELIEMCIATGMRFTPKELLPIRTVCGTDHVDEVLKDVHMNATARLREKNIMDKELELLIVVLPEDGSIYGRVKTVCETELGIVTQCCLPKIIIRPNNQIRGNLALKINAKVGGRNTVLNDFLVKRVPLVTDMPTIIFGADVTHPKPFEDSSTSIAAVVASQDWPEITKYCSLVSTQMHRQDIIQDLYTEWEDPKRGKVAGGMIRDLLISFRESNKQLPGRIIFYRDGVSEGQFCRALQHELQSIQKACASIESNYCPTVTFVVVQKRHHTRLFPFDHNDQRFVDRRSGNILPGTVVDTQICHPVGYDFYLCSHAGIQGTSQPPRYYVVWDENGFKPDDLQTLTNNLCYTYASCTRSVSVVPAVYYAHKMALRAKHYMEETYEGESSAGGSGNGGQGPSVVRPLPKIKENVRKLMFYC